jgi:uncharacterized protein YacL
MVLHVLRALFVLLMGAAGWTFVLDPSWPLGTYTWMALALSLVLAVLFIGIDILSPRRKLVVLSGTFFGLVVGVLAAYALSFVVTLLVDYAVSYINSLQPEAIVTDSQRESLARLFNLLVGIISCYLTISFILQTKDDFRFIIPYVEFHKQSRGVRQMLLDTSVLIDGRIADIIDAGIIESEMLVPQFVVRELRALADSGERLKRNRGKRGQEILQRLLDNKRVTTRITEAHARDEQGATEVDERLLLLAKELNARLLTTDGPLTKEARLTNVDVVNLNDIATAVRLAAMPGERMSVMITKPGESQGQGVGYLDDGTMVVIEDGRPYIGKEVEFTVTNTRQTPVGKMVFGRIGDGDGGGGGPRTASSTSAQPRPAGAAPRRPTTQTPAT